MSNYIEGLKKGHRTLELKVHELEQENKELSIQLAEANAKNKVLVKQLSQYKERLKKYENINPELIEALGAVMKASKAFL